MAEMDVIDRFLETFIAYIDSGFGLLAGDVAYLTSTLIVIDVTLAGLFWALSQNADVISGLLKKVLYVGFFAFLLGNFSFLSSVIFESFAELGIKGGSGTLAAADLMRPGFIAGVGFEAALPLLQEIGEMLGPIGFFENFVLIAVMLIAWAVILIAFFVLAIQLFVTILEFKLTTLAGFVLVPFALWNKTTFLAERVLGNVITSGLKLMVLAIIIGIGSTLFASVTDAFTGTEDVTLAQVMGTVLASAVRRAVPCRAFGTRTEAAARKPSARPVDPARHRKARARRRALPGRSACAQSSACNMPERSPRTRCAMVTGDRAAPHLT